MKISAIVAMSENRVIGKEGQLPWRLPEDLKRFRKITLGHPVIMGRKTFESIGKALPQRQNIVVTRQTDFFAEGVQVVHSLEAAIEACEGKCDELFVIGGAEIYRKAFPRIDCLYLTEIHCVIDGDAYFLDFDRRSFRETSREDHTLPVPHSFLVLERV